MKIANKLAASILTGVFLMAVPSFVSAVTPQQKNEAMQLVEKGNKAKKLVEQEMYYNKAIELDPDCVDAYFKKGFIYYLNRKYQEALDNYDKVISINSKYPKIHVYKANVFADLNKYEQVIKEFDKAIDCDPKNKFLYIDAANWCKKIGDNEHALEVYSKALSNKLGNEEHSDYSKELSESMDDGYFLYWRGKLYYDMGKKEEAMSDFSDILKIADSPSQRWAHQFRGRIYSEEQDYQQAINEYTKMLEIWHHDGWAYLLRGYAYYYSGNKQKALDDFREAVNIHKSVRILSSFRPDALYGEYVSTERFCAMTYDAMAFYFYEDKQYNRALENINEAIKFEPGNIKYKERQEEIIKAKKGFDKPREL